MNNSRKIIISNVFWATLGKLVRIFTELLVGVLVARYLGPGQYGLMNYVISYVTIFSIIASFGLDNIEIRELSRNERPIKEILGTALRLRIIFSVVTILLLVITLIITGSDYFTSILIMIYSLSIIFSSFNVIRNYFTSIVKNKYVVIAEIVRCIIGALIKAVLLLLHAELIWFIVALTFDFILVASGYFTAYRKVGKIGTWYFHKKTAFLFIKEAFPLLLSGTAIIVYQRIDQVMIKNMINNDSVAYFSVAGKISEFILFVPLIMSQTITPLLVRIREKNENEYKIKKQYYVDVIVWLSIILAVIVSASSYYLIRYSFGSEYLAAVPVLQILAFKTIGMALSSSSGQLIIIERTQKWAVIRNIIGCIVCVLGNLIFIPYFGIIGSAWATIFTIFISGYLCNVAIGAYREIFFIQCNSLFFGWKRLLMNIVFVKK